MVAQIYACEFAQIIAKHGYNPKYVSIIRMKLGSSERCPGKLSSQMRRTACWS
jgi:hypothetical protein